MTLLSVIAALALEHYWEFPGRKDVFALLFRHADYVKQKLDGGKRGGRARSVHPERRCLGRRIAQRGDPSR